MLSEGNNVPKDVKAAHEIFLSACAKNVGDACNAAGVGFRDGDLNGKRDYDAALPWFDKGCVLESTKGCNNAAKIHQDLRDDNGNALTLFARSCALGGDRGVAGCIEGGRIVRSGAKGVAKDEKRAGELFSRGCSLGAPQACTEARAMGIDVRLEAGGSFAVNEKNCAGGEVLACATLGADYLSGTGVRKDEAKALELFRVACRGGIKYGCRDVAKLLLFQETPPKKDDIAEGLSALKMACAEREGTSCKRLGDVLLIGLYLPRDLTAAIAAYRTACQIAPPDGCQEAGALTRDQGKDGASIAKAIFRDGCARGDGESCAGLESLGERTVGLKEAGAENALTRQISNCEKGGKRSDCYAAATRFHKDKDFVSARKYFDLACSGESANACGMVAMYAFNDAKNDPALLAGAVEASVRACSFGHPHSCKKALEKSQELGDDIASKTKTSVTAACKKGVEGACKALEAGR